MNHPTKGKQAFTLIELLVTIAIISILAGILFPVFSQARESARRATCMSNLKQITLGILQYAQDNDGTLMPWNGGSRRGGNSPYYQEDIQPYVKNYQIFRCPNAKFLKPTLTNEIGLHWPTYGFNGAGNSKSLYRYGGFKLAAINEASISWMVVETKYTQARWESDGWGYPGCNFNGSVPEGASRWRPDDHLGGSNVAFVDGHVKWIKKGANVKGYHWQTNF